MKMVDEWEGIGSAQSVQIHPIIKAKIRKTRRKMKRHEENGKIPSGTGHARPCASHHGPWWALSLPVRLLLQCCVLYSFGASIWATDFAYVGSFWASFVSFFDPHGLFTSSNYM